MSPLAPDTMAARLASSKQVRIYATAVDRESAREMLAERAADAAEAQALKELLTGPTALTFVRGDAASAARLSGVTNCAPLAVNTGVTLAPALRSARVNSSALNAAMPPPTMRSMRLPFMADTLAVVGAE